MAEIAVWLDRIGPGDVIKDQDGRWQHRCPHCKTRRTLERSAGVLMFDTLQVRNPTTCPNCRTTYTISNGAVSYYAGRLAA